jgi:hypothetical protein
MTGQNVGQYVGGTPVARWFVAFACAIGALYFLGSVIRYIEMIDHRRAAQRGVMLALMAGACILTVMAL